MTTVKWILPAAALCFSALPLTVRSEEPARALLAPNTSASRSFAATPNGNLGGMTSVSDVNVHTLLYPGNTTKVLAHYLPWWFRPEDRGVKVGYRSDDPEQARRTFADMQARGVDGVIVDWYGRTKTDGQPDEIDQAWQKSMPELAKFPKLSFSIMVDAGTYNFNRCKNCDITQTVISQLDYISRAYISSPQYLKYNGHPVVFEFGLDWVKNPANRDDKPNWSRIHAAHPEISWIHIHKQGFDRDYSAGAFVWVTPGSAAKKTNEADLSNAREFYRYAQTEGAKISTAGVFKGFDDSMAPWAKADPHYMPQACGATWLQSFDLVNQFYNTDRQLPFLQLITWNDYEEGTALESGIDSCVTLQTQLSGNALAVKLTNAPNVDHLELYEALPDDKFRLVNRYAPQTATIELPANASGTFYVKAVGKPFFRNVLSAPVSVARPKS